MVPASERSEHSFSHNSSGGSWRGWKQQGSPLLTSSFGHQSDAVAAAEETFQQQPPKNLAWKRCLPARTVCSHLDGGWGCCVAAIRLLSGVSLERWEPLLCPSWSHYQPHLSSPPRTAALKQQYVVGVMVLVTQDQCFRVNTKLHAAS